jgi:hypothetical protein
VVEFKVKVHRKQRQAYIPKAVVEDLGHELRLLPDKNAAVIYPEGKSLAKVLESVRLLLRDLELRADEHE